MNFEAIPLYSKNILRSATSEEARNKHVLQKQKKCVWKIKIGAIKMYGPCQDKRICLKKGNKRRNDRTRLLQEVRAFHKRYFSLWEFMKPGQMVCD